MDQVQAINQLVEELSGSERARLLYLCESPEEDASSEAVKRLLGQKVLEADAGQMLLGELMVRLRRFDILRRVCNTNRAEVERTLSVRHVVPIFRVLMANISEDLGTEDLSSIKFLLSRVLPREKLEKSKSFLDVVIELEKLEKVSPGRVDLVEESLQGIGRMDLAKKVSAYKRSAASSEQISQQQRSRTPGPSPPTSSQHQAGMGQEQAPIREKGSFKGSVPRCAATRPGYQKPLDFYRLSSGNRGVCLVIDCVGHDGDLLGQTFAALHFRVDIQRRLGYQQILLKIKETIRQRELTPGDALVCCIISRGTSNRLLGADSDAAGLHVDTIRSLFNANGCPALAGKPKLVFIQRYKVAEFQPHNWREHRDEDLETDGLINEDSSIPEDADIFWSHCWTDERQLEQGQHRSAYVRALSNALLKGQRRKTHLTDLHTEVNKVVFEHNSRNPGAAYHIDLKYTLRKNLYL